MAYEIPANLMVEGIRAVDQHAVVNRSALLVPKEFDKSKYVGKWAFVGASAEAAQLPQRLVEQYVVDGWTIWKDKEDKTCVRPLGGKQVVLLFRPKVLQQAVNAVYGNLSKQRAIAEQQGRTVQGQNVPQGMLPGATVLKGYDPASNAESDPIGYTFNKIPAIRDANVGARGVEITSSTARRRRKPVAVK